ncbi:hypothetical protein ACFL5P_03265 [candidate division KSB1 bacterium]
MFILFSLVVFGIVLLFLIFLKLQKLKETNSGKAFLLQRLLNISAVFVFLFIAFIVSLTCLEICLQIKYYGDRFRGNPWYAGGNHPPDMVIPDLQRGYKLNPGFEGMEVNLQGEFKVPVSINSVGMRGQERKLNRDCINILGLGDSFVFGEGVKSEDSFLYRLENSLNNIQQDIPVEIYNDGVPAYNLEQNYLSLKDFCDTIVPDWVIVGVSTLRLERLFEPYTCLNGYLVKKSHLPTLYYVHGNLYQSRMPSEILRKTETFLKGHLYSMNFLKDNCPNIFKETRDFFRGFFPEKVESTVIYPSPTPAVPYQSKEVEAGLLVMDKIKSLSEQHGFKIYVFLYEGNPNMDSLFEDYCETKNIPFCNVTGAMNDARDRGVKVNFEYDRHWTEEGHKIAADLLFSEFAEYLLQDNHKQ